MALRNGALLALVIVAVLGLASAADPDPLIDHILTVPGGRPVVGNDFAFRALSNVAPTGNDGSAARSANVNTFPALEGQGISYTFINYAPCGQNPIHTHPRATEFLFLLEGTLYVGFVDTNNTLFSTVITSGDSFVFPRGLVHFQQNPNPNVPARALAALNSQNPGTQRIGNALFSATGIPTTVVQVALNANRSAVDEIKRNFPPSGNARGTINTGCSSAIVYPY